MKEWLNVKECADYLGVSISQLWLYRQNDKLFPVAIFKGHRTVRFSKSEIDSWMRSGEGASNE